jgi:large subunit ribosomal protein L1
MAETKKKPAAKIKTAKKAELVAETATVKKAPEKVLEIDKDSPKPLAKAGKRSSKAVKESEAKQAKESRKAESTAEVKSKAKSTVKPPRAKLERAGKKYQEKAKQIDPSKVYSLSEALELATKTNPSKFDASVEIHINLGVDPKIADQNIRGSVSMPAGTGKNLKIAVFADDKEAADAKKAGAEIIGTEAITAKLEKEQLDFDILITSPVQMSKLAKYAKLLGPRGLMPNPKSGTVTANISKAVMEAKAGKIEYRTDSSGIIHTSIGKASFSPAALQRNADSLLTSIRAAKPASLKGTYIKNIHITTSMGPSIKTATSTP